MLLIKSTGPLDIWLTPAVSNDCTHVSAGDFRKHWSLQITCFRGGCNQQWRLNERCISLSFIFHNGMPTLQRGCRTHLLPAWLLQSYESSFPVPHTSNPLIPVLFMWDSEMRVWGRKDECNVLYCSSMGSSVNIPEAHGKWKREVNKSVEAKDAICTFPSVRSH